jgi:hypothetical protein
MGHSIRTKITIAAAPGDVWDVLVDFDRYGDWNPFIVEASGHPAPGERLALKMTAGAKTFTVRPNVVERRDGERLRWVGRLGVPGLFDADHIHELHQTAAGTQYVQREEFSGVLVPFLGKTLAATEAAFEDMNRALRRRVERAPGQASS